MVEIKNLSKKYGFTQALNDVSVSFGPGEIIGLFGENGAGKTTFIKSVLGLISFDGQALLDGQPVNRRNICRLSLATCEHSFFPALSPEEHKEFYEDHFDAFREKRFEGLMEFFGLPGNKPLRSFSTGQQNQFEVIMALCQGADYILMDEPFAGSDIFNREDFYKVLTGILEPSETVLISTHLIEEVSGLVGRALLLHQGRLIGDVNTLDLAEEGKTLVDCVKENYNYREDRVSKALSRMIDAEGDESAEDK